MENVPLLQVKKMSKAFSNQLVLKEVNLQVEHGDIYALVGGNGAGKSTLMKILTGLYSYDSGEMYVKGKRQQFVNPKEAHQEGIYLIPQEPLIFPHMTIEENICIGLKEKKKKLKVQIQQLISSLGWDIDLNKLGGTLSIAQQQLVEIVRGLIREAEILILDEPTSTLTTHEIKSLFVLMKSLQEKGIGMIYITHRFPEIFEIANKVAILRDGMVVSQGDVCDYTYDMLMEGLLPKGYKQKEKIEVVQETAKTKKILEVVDINGHAFENISFTVHAGEVVGVAGIIGSGRTELAEAIFGLKAIKSGSILLEGKSIDTCSLHKRLSEGLVYVPEDRARNGIFSIASVKENIAAATSLYQNNRFFINQEKESALVNSFIEQFRIVVQNMNKELASLSGGNQQKVVLAKYLACNPKIIILDEPTRGIDAKARLEVYETIKKMKREGLAILLISSDVEEIVQLVNRVYVMRNGRFVSHMEKEQLSVNEVTRLAYGGVAE
ncbi:sugar ABC transporter ATP-binding protein [Bacillus thuringiensis]|uniref:sugar ABC transporter ATP-binding protein n=1 Tax=Bacillus thuringiensis TaxID=1428 RepID=UPI003458BD29